MKDASEVDRRLRAIREATDGLAPREGFEARLERLIEAEDALPVLALIARQARPLLAASLLVAALALGVAVHARSQALDAVSRAAATETLR